MDLLLTCNWLAFVLFINVYVIVTCSLLQHDLQINMTFTWPCSCLLPYPKIHYLKSLFIKVCNIQKHWPELEVLVVVAQLLLLDSKTWSAWRIADPFGWPEVDSDPDFPPETDGADGLLVTGPLWSRFPERPKLPECVRLKVIKVNDLKYILDTKVYSRYPYTF